MKNSSSIKVVLLGLAQDAGVPQIGCDCRNCQSINSEEGWPVSLAIIDNDNYKFWIIDATPKFPQQYNWLRKQYPKHQFSGILLTHAHIGHYTGLMYLGREAMNSTSTPVYATSSMQKFIRTNAPWSQLVDLKNIELANIKPIEKLEISNNLTIKPITVTHRSEFSDTLAFLIQGQNKKLFYCPDIDHWRGLDLSQHLSQGDYALLDGTFFSQDELPGRDLTKIPHPLVTQTIEFVKDQPFKTWIIHLNHSNPLWCSDRDRNLFEENGIERPKFGQSWFL